MSKDIAANRDVIELYGREFNIVKSGLAEAQVIAFVNELMEERERLVQRQEHMASLTKLAERTVAEAEKLAEEIKKDSVDQANNEVAKLLSEAETKAHQIFEENKREILSKATEEAKAIKAQAEQEGAQTLERYRNRIKPELNELAQRVYKELLTELESLKGHVATFEAKFERKLAQPVDSGTFAEPVPAEGPDELADIVKPPVEPNRNGQQPEWELEFLPPIDIMKIMRVVAYLDQLPQVDKTEIIPEASRPSIIVYLNEPLNLVEALKKLSEVGQVKEVESGEAGEGKRPHRAQVMLLGKGTEA